MVYLGFGTAAVTSVPINLEATSRGCCVMARSNKVCASQLDVKVSNSTVAGMEFGTEGCKGNALEILDGFVDFFNNSGSATTDTFSLSILCLDFDADVTNLSWNTVIGIEGVIDDFIGRRSRLVILLGDLVVLFGIITTADLDDLWVSEKLEVFFDSLIKEEGDTLRDWGTVEKALGGFIDDCFDEEVLLCKITGIFGLEDLIGFAFQIGVFLLEV